MLNWLLTKVQKQFSEGRDSRSTNSVGAIEYYRQKAKTKKKTRPKINLTPYKKDESRMNHELKYKMPNYKTCRKKANRKKSLGSRTKQSYWT